MKTLKILLYTVVILILNLSINSCSGDDGEQGAVGNDGNANVKVGVVDLTSADWLWNSSYVFSTSNTSTTSHATRYTDIEVPAITESIHTTGLVLVFFQPSTSVDGWEALPFQFTNFSSVFNTNIAYRSEVSKIRLHYFWTRNTTGTFPTGLSTYTIADTKVKYIVIEGTAIGATATAKIKQSKQDIINELQKANIDINDYNAVCKYYNIEPK